MNIGNLLLLNANRYPENVAIVFRGLRLTYRELNKRVNRLSHHLLTVGVKKGDRVGFMFYNSNQFVEIWFATQKIGAIAVPLNFRMVPREVKWILENSRCKVFAYSEACAAQVAPVKNDLPFVEHLIYSGKNPIPGEHYFESLTRDGDTGEPDIEVQFEDPSNIIYTGGTTGFPKGVVHTHRSFFFWQMSGALQTHYVGSDEININQLPLFHNAGLTALDMNIAAGGRFVILETFDPVEILRLIHVERATYIFLLPPAIYVRLLDVPNLKEFDTTSVRRFGGAAGGVSKNLMLRLFEAFPSADLNYGYGLTEAGAGIFHYITRSMVQENSPRITSIGREMPYAEVRLVDDQNREVPVGEIGEAVFRGPSTMKEYFDQPELTAETIKDGWVHSGDLLKKDPDGFFYFMDRKKDMIKSGGENVFAQEVEKVIMSHPLVELCAVIGVPDPKFVEAVMALIQLKKGTRVPEEEILELCKKELSSYKKPRRIVFVDSLPMNESGKILKFKLREQYSKMEE